MSSYSACWKSFNVFIFRQFADESARYRRSTYREENDDAAKAIIIPRDTIISRSMRERSEHRGIDYRTHHVCDKMRFEVVD